VVEDVEIVVAPIQLKTIGISPSSLQTMMGTTLVAPHDPGTIKDGDYLQDTFNYKWQSVPEVFTTMAKIIPDVSY